VRYDLTGKKTWEQFFDGANGYQDRAYDVEIGGTKIFVTGKSENGNGENYASVCYERMDRPQVVISNQQGVNYIQNEVIVRFDPSSLKMSAIDNRDKRFGLTGDFIEDSIVTKMSLKVGTDVSKWKLVKVFPDLTSNDSLSTSRLGTLVKVPSFWATFILVTSGMSEETIADSLNLMQPHIWYSELNGVLDYHSVPNDSRFLSKQFSLYPAPQFINSRNDINSEQAWDIETGKSFIRVGIFDTGIDQFNQDLNGGVIQGGYDYYHQTSLSAPYDVEGHGTACAGIIGAKRNNSVGVAGIAGGDIQNGQFGVSLYDMRVSEDGVLGSSAIISQAIFSGANSMNNGGFELAIMNASWGSESYYQIINDAFRFAHQNDVVICASRGNSGSNVPDYPACYMDEQILNTGASGIDGSYQVQNQFDQYSTDFGAGMDFIAPGVDTLVNTCSPGLQNYTPFNGTSAGAPHVSGIAALMLSYYNQPITTPLNLAPEDVEQLIERSCVDITTNNATPGYDQYSGWGRVDANAALLGLSPQYKIHHYSDNYNLTNNTVVVNVAQNNSVINFPFAILNLAAGNYVCQQYEITHTFQYNDIAPSEQIIAFWPRPSSSIGFRNASVLYNDNYCEIVSCSNNQMVLKTYMYMVLSDMYGNQINRLIGAPSTVNSIASATIYTYDPTISGVQDYFDAGYVSIFPNPSNHLTTVSIQTSTPEQVKVRVFDLSGRLTETPANAITVEGRTETTINTTNYAEGMYIISIQIGEAYIQRKLVVKH
jgi:hypothetical protein